MPQSGQPIPLVVQLYDGGNATTYYPTAKVYDNLNNLLSTVSLNPVGSNGLYTNYSMTMPSAPFVVAIYQVFMDSAHTTPAPQYQIGSETFPLIPAAGGSSGDCESVQGEVSLSVNIQGCAEVSDNINC